MTSERTSNPAHQDEKIPEEVREFATKMFNLARSGDVSLLDYVDAGVDVNLSNQDGNSLLMLAAYSGHVDVVRGLLGRGADVELLNSRGQSILAGAVFKGDEDIVSVLLAADASPEAGQPSARETARMFGREDLLGPTA